VKINFKLKDLNISVQVKDTTRCTCCMLSLVLQKHPSTF